MNPDIDVGSESVQPSNKRVLYALRMAVIWVLAPNVVNLSLGGRLDSIGGQSPITETTLGNLVWWASGSVTLVVIIFAYRSRPKAPRRIVWNVVLCALMFFLSVKVIESAFSRDIYSVVGLVVWILMLGLVGTSKFSIEDLRVWGEVGLAIVIVSFALAFFGGSGWMSDTSYVVGQGKDGLLSERLLAGPFNHSNQLGIIVAITLPFVAFWKYGPKLKIVALMLMGAALLMSASRSSALVLVLVVGFALVLLAVRKIFSISFGNFVIGSALSGAVALIVLIPYFGLPDEFATGRGIIWRVSTEVALSSFSFPASPELLQPDGWVSLAIGYAPSHSHNSTLTALIVGGWAFFAINVAVLITAMHRAVAVASFSTIPALSVLTLLGLSAVETVWRLDSLSQSTGLAALIVLTMTSIYESTTHKEDSLPVKKSLAIPKNRFPGSRRI